MIINKDKAINAGIMALSVIVVCTVLVIIINKIPEPIEPAEQSLGVIAGKLITNEKTRDILFTDSIENEDIIIYSDRKDYYSLGGGGVHVYFSITNISLIDQDIEVMVITPDNRTAQVRYIEVYSHNTTENKLIKKGVSIETATGTLETFDRYEDIPLEVWDRLTLKDFEGKYEKDLLKPRKDIKEYKPKKEGLVNILAGETRFLRAEILWGDMNADEWFIEAFGSKGSYGHLDPNGWTYEQDFEDLNTGDLQGQDSWTGDGDYDVSTTNPLEGSQGVLFSVPGAVEKSVQRSITAVTSGTVCMSMEKSNCRVHTPMVRLYDGGTLAIDWAMQANAQCCEITVRDGATVPTMVISASNVTFASNETVRGCIEFETGAGSWEGLSADTWQLTLDGGTTYGDNAPYDFFTAVAEVDVYKLQQSATRCNGGDPLTVDLYYDWISPDYEAAADAAITGQDFFWFN